MGTTHIVSVGTRGLDDFSAGFVQGFGSWTIGVNNPPNPFSTGVGDVVVDASANIYLITAIAPDGTTLTVRDIGQAGGVAPFSGFALPAEGDTTRAYSTIGNAVMDIQDIVSASDDTWECHVYNDSEVLENTVIIDDVSLIGNGTIKITAPETERHTGKFGTGATWGQLSWA